MHQKRQFREFVLPLANPNKKIKIVQPSDFDASVVLDSQNNVDDLAVQQKLNHVNSTAHLFRAIYRTSQFCVYESPTQIVKIGDNDAVDVNFFHNQKARPFLPNLSLFYYNDKFISQAFNFTKSSSDKKVMLLFNRRQQEMRLCDIDTSSWDLDTRVACFRLLVDMVTGLHQEGIRFTTHVNPGLVSLYKTRSGTVRACCCEHEVLVADAGTNNINEILQYMPRFFGLRHSVAHRGESIFTLSGPEPTFDYAPRYHNNLSQVMITTPRFSLPLAGILAQQQCNNDMVFCISDEYKVSVKHNLAALKHEAILMKESMPSTLPPCYFVTEHVTTVKGCKTTFTNFTDPCFHSSGIAQEFMYNKETSPVTVFVQRQNTALLTLPDFLLQYPNTSNDDLHSILRKIVVLWYRLAFVGIVVGIEASFNNIYVRPLDRPSTQLQDVEYITLSDIHSRYVRLPVDCTNCKYDVFIDLNNQRLTTHTKTKMYSFENNYKKVVCVAPLLAFLAKITEPISSFQYITNEVCAFMDKYHIQRIGSWFKDQFQFGIPQQMTDLFQVAINIYTELHAPAPIPALTIVTASNVDRDLVVVGFNGVSSVFMDKNTDQNGGNKHADLELPLADQNNLFMHTLQ